MAGKLSGRRRRSTGKRNSNHRVHLQKPSGTIGPRVAKVGGDRFAIVCIDPAQHRSEWMMADYFGKILIEPQTLEHQWGHFKAAFALIRPRVGPVPTGRAPITGQWEPALHELVHSRCCREAMNPHLQHRFGRRR